MLQRLLLVGVVAAALGCEAETGPEGPPGPAGAEGDPGAPGTPGEDGDPGEPGMDGEQGNVGPKGNQGDDGDQGPQGQAGQQGPEGPAGPEGPQGPQGEQGPPGPAGPAAAGVVTFDTVYAVEAIQNIGAGLNGDVQATCQNGDIVISGSCGYSVADNGIRLRFSTPVMPIFPNPSNVPGPRGWLCQYTNNGGGGNVITARAVCVDLP